MSARRCGIAIHPLPDGVRSVRMGAPVTPTPTLPLQGRGRTRGAEGVRRVRMGAPDSPPTGTNRDCRDFFSISEFFS